MIFVNYWLAVPSCIFVGIVIASVWASRVLRRKMAWVRILVSPVLGVMVLLSAVITGLCLWDVSNGTVSAPVYSPDHSKAIRITSAEDDWGGGQFSRMVVSQAEIYSNFGLSSEKVLLTEDIVPIDPQNVRWVNDSEVLIRARAAYGLPECNSARRVKVRCERMD